MKNLLALVGLAVVAFAAAGWYLGWYKIGRSVDAQGKPQLNIQVHPDEIKSDLNKVGQQGAVLLEKGSTPPPPPPQPPQSPIPLPPWPGGNQVPSVQPPAGELQWPALPPLLPPVAPPKQGSGWLISW